MDICSFKEEELLSCLILMLEKGEWVSHFSHRFFVCSQHAQSAQAQNVGDPDIYCVRKSHLAWGGKKREKKTPKKQLQTGSSSQGGFSNPKTKHGEQKSISELTTHWILRQMGYNFNSRWSHQVPLLTAKNRNLRLHWAPTQPHWTEDGQKDQADVFPIFSCPYNWLIG